MTAKLLGRGVAVSPIVTVEPRRRKFHKAITLSMPAPKAHSQGMINQYSGNAPTLRLLCSITGTFHIGFLIRQTNRILSIHCSRTTQRMYSFVSFNFNSIRSIIIFGEEIINFMNYNHNVIRVIIMISLICSQFDGNIVYILYYMNGSLEYLFRSICRHTVYYKSR